MAKRETFSVKQPKAELPKNSWDLTEKLNMSAKFGYYYPCYVRPVVPNSSFRIKPKMLFKTMPMVFPVHTRMRAHLEFYYCRDRNVWDDFQDVSVNTSNEKLPWLRIPEDRKDRVGIGSFLDYMGVPTSVVSHNKRDESFTLTSDGFNIAYPTPSSLQLHSGGFPYIYMLSDENINGTRLFLEKTFGEPFTVLNNRYTNYSARSVLFMPNESLVGNLSSTSRFVYMPNTVLEGLPANITGRLFLLVNARNITTSSGFAPLGDKWRVMDISSNVRLSLNDGYYTLPLFDVSVMHHIQLEGSNLSVNPNPVYDNLLNRVEYLINKGFDVKIAFASRSLYSHIFESQDKYSFNILNGTISITDIDVPTVVDASYSQSPFTGDNPSIPLNAIPCRHYESIVNTYHRNLVVDPFKIDDKIQYNRVVTNKASGPDDVEYDFAPVDWEDDFLTKALPSPQQGLAPLLGARSQPNQIAEILVTHDDGSTESLRINTNPDDGGVTGINSYGTTADDKTVSAMQEMINFGISINDLRSVNALQKYLERNINAGFRYKDVIESRFGISLEFKMLDMPVYIGGISSELQVDTVVNQTSSHNDDVILGEEAGRGFFFGQSDNDIYCKCDEHGYIIGIISFTVIPTYTQLLPKHWLQRETLDYFNPEFSHLGPQPIDHREVAPLETFLEDKTKLSQTFGYQRINYDLISTYDKAVGQYKSTLKDYLVTRTFEGIPELSPEFIHMDQNDLNDVFAYQAGDDKIFGEILFNVDANLPIPRFSTPTIQ